MTLIEFDDGLSYHMDDRLHRGLLKIKKKISKQDEDYVLIVDGPEGTGKSTLSLQMGKFIDPTLNINRICFTGSEFKEKVINAKQNQCIIFDEAFRGLSSKSTLSEINKLLVSMMMEMRQKNLFIIIVIPTFFLLEKYVALFRARALVHTFRDKKGNRGKFCVFKYATKKGLYLHPKCKAFYSYMAKGVKPNFHGKFFGKYAINEEEYKKKKKEALHSIDQPTKKEEHYLERNKLITIIFNLLGESTKMTEMELNKGGIPLKQRQIRRIISQNHEKSENLR